MNNVIDDLVANPKKLAELKKNMQRLSESYSINATIDIFENLCTKKP